MRTERLEQVTGLLNFANGLTRQGDAGKRGLELLKNLFGGQRFPGGFQDKLFSDNLFRLNSIQISKARFQLMCIQNKTAVSDPRNTVIARRLRLRFLFQTRSSHVPPTEVAQPIDLKICLSPGFPGFPSTLHETTARALPKSCEAKSPILWPGDDRGRLRSP